MNLSTPTDPRLLEALKEASQRKQSASEMREQRVSYVYGSLDKKSGVTRESVRQMLMEREGFTEAER